MHGRRVRFWYWRKPLHSVIGIVAQPSSAGVDSTDIQWVAIDRERGRAYWLAAAAILPAVSYLLARAIELGPHSGPWAYWPINGLLCGILFRRAYRDWAPIGTLAVMSQVGVIYLVRGDLAGGATVVGAVSGLLQAIFAALVLRWSAGDAGPFDKPRNLVWFVAVAVCLVPLAITPVSALLFAHRFGISFGSSWAALFVGNALSMLLFAPPVMGAWRRERETKPWRAGVKELVLGQVAIVALALAIFAAPPFLLSYAVLPYAMFPMLAWSSLRGGPLLTSLAVVGISTIAAWCTAHGTGPFALDGSMLGDRVLLLQTYLALLAVSAMLLSALSEQRRSAFERLALQISIREAFLDGSNAILLLKDLEGRLLIANRAYRELVQDAVVHAMDSSGHPFMSDAESAVVRARELRVIEAGASGTFDESFVIDGAARQFVVTRFPVRDQGGTARYLGVIAREVTLEQRLSDRLQRAQGVEMIGQLTAGVAHDLNNRLSTIVMSTALLKDAVRGTAEHGELIAHLESAASSAARLTRRLLSLGRPREPRHGVIAVDEALRELEPMLRVLVRGVGELRTSLGAGTARVVGDPLTIEQVVLNLVANARDAITGDGTITLSTAIVPASAVSAAHGQEGAADEWIRLCVADTGSGMDETALRSLFEPFFSTKAEHGTGLGLYTTAMLVRTAQGHIHATSQPGAGTTFVVDLPASR